MRNKTFPYIKICLILFLIIFSLRKALKNSIFSEYFIILDLGKPYSCKGKENFYKFLHYFSPKN